MYQKVPEKEFYFFLKLSKKCFNELVSWFLKEPQVGQKISWYLKQRSKHISFKMSEGVIRTSLTILCFLCVNGFQITLSAFILKISKYLINKYYEIGLCLAEKLSGFFLSSQYWTKEKLMSYPKIYDEFFQKFVSVFVFLFVFFESVNT